MKTVTKENFEAEVLNSDKPVLVDFYADWCGPCVSLTPILEQLETELADQIKIVKVDVDASKDVSDEYNVRAMPTLLVFRGGDVIAKRMGGGTKSEMSTWINESLALPEGTKISLGSKPVKLTDEDKLKLSEIYRRAVDSFADADEPIEGATWPSGKPITRREYVEIAITSGALFDDIARNLAEENKSVDEFIEDYKTRLNLDAPKP